MEEIISISPDKQHKAKLIIAGEIRFGPIYYLLELNGKRFKERIFGESYRWSEDSQYFCIQEWLTTDYNEGPITQLIIIDLMNKKECIVSQAHKGFINPIGILNNKITYSKDYYAQGISKEFETELEQLVNWKKI